MDEVSLLPGAAFDYDLPCGLRTVRDRCLDDPLCGWCASVLHEGNGTCFQACQWGWDTSHGSGGGGLITFTPELDGRCPHNGPNESVWELREDGTTCLIGDAVRGYMTMIVLLNAIFVAAFFWQIVSSCCCSRSTSINTEAAFRTRNRYAFLVAWLFGLEARQWVLIIFAALVRYQVSNRSQHRPQDVISAIALFIQYGQVITWPVSPSKYLAGVAVYVVGFTWGIFLYASGAFFQYVALLGQLQLLALLELQDLIQFHDQEQRTTSHGRHRAARLLMGFVHLCTILAFGLSLADVFASQVPPVELVVPQIVTALPAAIHLLEMSWVLGARCSVALQGKLVRPYQRVSTIGTPELQPFKTIFYD